MHSCTNGACAGQTWRWQGHTIGVIGGQEAGVRLESSTAGRVQGIVAHATVGAIAGLGLLAIADDAEIVARTDAHLQYGFLWFHG